MASFCSCIIAATLPGFSTCALATALVIFMTTAAITYALTTAPNTITAIARVLGIFFIVVPPREGLLSA